MCYSQLTLHNRLACKRPQVYLSLAEAVVAHPAVGELVVAKCRSAEAAFGALGAVGDDLGVAVLASETALMAISDFVQMYNGPMSDEQLHNFVRSRFDPLLVVARATHPAGDERT